MRTLHLSGLALIVALALAGPATAQQNLEDVEIQTIEVAEGVHMLMGAGGNIGVSAGEDGVFLIDDQYAPLTEKIASAIGELSDAPIRFVLNTHWHGDHTGGNENMGEMGVLIVAHENVRERMSVDQFMEAFDRTVPASPEVALPVVTFTDAVTFHLNGEEIHAYHVDPAHTDGDAVIHFRNADVVHMGDTYFNGFYPFIDVASGGSINGMVEAVDGVLAMADGDTKIIPGHGPLSNAEELRAYRDMLATIRDRIRQLIAEGKSEDEVVAANPTRGFDEEWGDGFLNPEQFTRLAYQSMANSDETM